MSGKISGMYHITHIDNLPSILNEGILSHSTGLANGISYTKIYDDGIVSNRQHILIPGSSNSLWDYANFYFNARNPMLYRVTREKSMSNIVVLRIKKSLLNNRTREIWVTDGNAASSITEFSKPDDKDFMNRIKEITTIEFWTGETKRTIMAEFLIRDKVEPKYIDCIFTANPTVAETIKKLPTLPKTIDVIPEPNLFFRPDWQDYLTANLSLARGDMFFSTMQTLTISVNTVGVMGKGLASRARYQFPDVYVRYEDLCKKKKLKMGEPYLIKREQSIFSELSEIPNGDENSNWFLLFPTKNHWRERSELENIRAGMLWLRDHYKEWGLKSIALPALGCGLGGLDWKDVGPIMCSIAGRFDIPVTVYLPTEIDIPLEYRNRKYLLNLR